jgi:hypothetical protein
MVHSERAQARRDRGLAQIGRWTRYSVAAGVVLSGVFTAGIAHLLPGRPAAPGQGRASVQGGTRRLRLFPPVQAPRPAPARSEHVTSGGS